MQKKFLRIFVMSVVLISLGACIYANQTFAMDGDEFERVVRPNLWQITCRFHETAKKPYIYGHSTTEYEEFMPYKSPAWGPVRIYKPYGMMVPDNEKRKTCSVCKRYYKAVTLTSRDLRPSFRLEHNGSYQTLVIYDNKAANKKICQRAKPFGEMLDIMNRAQIRSGTSIPMKTALERLWRATRPSYITYRIEKEDCQPGPQRANESTPLCTTESDILLLKTINYTPIEERKTTSCCCSLL